PVAVLDEEAAEDPAVVPLAGGVAAALAVDEDPRRRLLRERLERAVLVAWREQHFDELTDEQTGELLRDGSVEDDDAPVCRDRVRRERALVRVLDRACDRHRARVRVLDDHASRQLELAEAEARRIKVVEVVVRQLPAVQLLDLGEQMPPHAELGVVGRALVRVLAVREIEYLPEAGIHRYRQVSRSMNP